MLQSGFPDLHCSHATIMNGRSAVRWVEIKLPGMKGSRWTTAQKEWFPKLCNNGTPIWIITGATEHEYKKLFEKFNFWEYFILKL